MQYDGTNLREVIEDHKKWLVSNRSGNFEKYRARFGYFILSCASLVCENLDGAIFTGTTISGCHFSNCSFVGALFELCTIKDTVMRNSDFSNVSIGTTDITNVSFANSVFRNADFRNMHFYGDSIDMSCTKLEGASFYHCNFDKTSFIKSNMTDAHFGYSCLGESNLTDAWIRNTHFNNAYIEKAMMPYFPMVCPDEGEFIAWKACRVSWGNEVVIVKLLIPKDAKRSSGTGRKCRADKAKVLEFQSLDGTKLNGKQKSCIVSWWNGRFTYNIGKIVKPEEPFCENRYEECASGIHFFMNREEAVRFALDTIK